MSSDIGPVIDDPWASLRALTPARIALGRAGAGLPTHAHLEFQLAHARARDAVHARLDVDALRARLPWPSIAVRSMARDRMQYLARPDLGRRLDPTDASRLDTDTALPDADTARLDPAGTSRVGPASSPPHDATNAGRHVAAIVVADGLSALAVERHAAALVGALIPGLTADGWTVAPIVVVEQGRVGIGDEIGQRLGATAVVVILGERPGLSAPDSLGAYFTYAPRVTPARTDAERNCVSNIHGGGVTTESAARTLGWLFNESHRRRLSGVALKNDASVLPPPG